MVIVYSAYDSFVSVRLFDVAGRQIKILYSGYQSAGKHELGASVAGVASGTYFCELSTNSVGGRTTQVKKMVVLR